MPPLCFADYRHSAGPHINIGADLRSHCYPPITRQAASTATTFNATTPGIAFIRLQAFCRLPQASGSHTGRAAEFSVYGSASRCPGPFQCAAFRPQFSYSHRRLHYCACHSPQFVSQSQAAIRWPGFRSGLILPPILTPLILPAAFGRCRIIRALLFQRRFAIPGFSLPGPLPTGRRAGAWAFPGGLGRAITGRLRAGHRAWAPRHLPGPGPGTGTGPGPGPGIRDRRAGRAPGGVLPGAGIVRRAGPGVGRWHRAPGSRRGTGPGPGRAFRHWHYRSGRQVCANLGRVISSPSHRRKFQADVYRRFHNCSITGAAAGRRSHRRAIALLTAGFSATASAPDFAQAIITQADIVWPISFNLRYCHDYYISAYISPGLATTPHCIICRLPG